MIPNMLEYYKMIRDNNISIIYNGPIWSDGLEGLGQTLRKRLEIEDTPLTIAQSVFSVFVEQMQNMLHYSAERENFSKEQSGETFEVATGVFILGVSDKKYFVQCGNKIRNEQVEKMKSRIDYLNTLDKVGLRKYYKECMRAENDNPESKGAGLGLIEIARRASSKMDYDFTALEEGYSFFTLFVTVG